MISLLGKMIEVTIDRPIGSLHPEYGFTYLLNYGYIPNSLSGDNEEIDCYIIGEFNPVKSFNGYIVAVIIREDDIEDKVVICKEKHKYNRVQIAALVEFQERFFKTKIIMLHDIL